jgi:hypothetical protein
MRTDVHLYEQYNRDGNIQITYRRANWILVGKEGEHDVRAVAVANGASNSHFGDRNHLKRLLNEGSMSFDEFTDAGIGFMRGLCCRLVGDGHVLGFVYEGRAA